MLTMSNKKIQTMTIPLQETASNYSDCYNKDQDIRQTTRSMSLIIFPSKRAIEKLKYFSQHINLHVTINFLLFMAKEDPFDDHCIESLQSKFRFTFHATILIKCYGDRTIKKWIPFNGNDSLFLNWGVWKQDTRLTLQMRDFDHPRRSSLGGQVLRIGTVEVKQKFFDSILDN